MLPKSENPDVHLSASMEVFEHYKSAPYGFFLTYEQLSKIVVDPQGCGRPHILKTRPWLLKRERLLCCKIGEGYYICQPRQNASWARTQNEASRRKQKRALEALAAAPYDLMAPEDQELNKQEQLRIGLPYAMGHQLEKVKTLTAETRVEMLTGDQLLSVLRNKKQIE